MKFRVAIARKAAREIEENYVWLAEHFEAAANRWRNSIEKADPTDTVDSKRSIWSPTFSIDGN
jgi:hypothetical protein